MSDEKIDSDEKCNAAANLKGEHIACDETPPHYGWPHGNREHGLIWIGNEPVPPSPGLRRSS